LLQAADGSWWAVFLGFRVTQPYSYYHILGRETFLAPVDWPKNGWPQINGNGTVDLVMNVSVLPPKPFAPKPARTEFDADTLGFEWQYLRNPIRENYSLSEKKGRLTIKAAPYTPDETESVSFLARRQTEHEFTAVTALTFQPEGETDEAGLILMQNNTHHYDLRLTKKGAQNVIQLRVRAGSIDYIAFEQPINDPDAELKIEGAPLYYTFYYKETGTGHYKKLGSMETRYLSTEVAGGFTGVMIGMYASSGG
jgi:alpha-N-arabinofuranosidase